MEPTELDTRSTQALLDALTEARLDLGIRGLGIRRSLIRTVRRRGRTWPWPARPAKVPQAPSEWGTNPPDFIGIGTQRGGSSWWYGLVDDHPGVFTLPGRQKELHFFDQFRDVPFADTRIAEYHSYFARPEGLIAGEWTPRYMYDPWTPGLILQAAPNAKLLVILRDPIERYRSGLTHTLVAGAPRNEVVVRDAFARGLYHEQLSRYLQYFPPDQILVLQLEQCRRDPKENLNLSYRHIGLEPPSYTPASMIDSVNQARTTKVELTGAARDVLVRKYRADAGQLAQTFDTIDLSLWPDLS